MIHGGILISERQLDGSRFDVREFNHGPIWCIFTFIEAIGLDHTAQSGDRNLSDSRSVHLARLPWCRNSQQSLSQERNVHVERISVPLTAIEPTVSTKRY